MPSGPDALAPQDHLLAKRRILLDGVFSRLMDTLTGGVILAGLGLFVGADNFTIGLLASLPFLAQVAQLPAIKLLVHVPDRRRVVVWATLAGRFLLLGIALLLVAAPHRFTPGLLVGAMAAIAVLAVLATASWNWWLRDVIPRGELGRYFGRRLRITATIAALLLPAAGALLDAFIGRGRGAEGYALLFALGGLFGILSTYFVARTPHPMPRVPASRERAMPQIARVVRAPEHRALLVSLSLLASTLTIALPFTAVYLLRTVGYGFVAVTLFALVSQFAYVGSLTGWGHLSDRFGNRPVLLIGAGMLVVSLLGWTLTWAERSPILFAYLVALHFLSGFAIGGIELSAANILLKTAPEQNAPAYLAGLSLVRALAAGSATLLAGAAWQALGSGTLLEMEPFGLTTWSVRGFHVLAASSVLVGLLAMLTLRRIPEEGAAPTLEVAKTMRRDVRALSSVAGIRAFVHTVSYVVEYIAGPKPPRRLPRHGSPGAPKR